MLTKPQVLAVQQQDCSLTNNEKQDVTVHAEKTSKQGAAEGAGWQATKWTEKLKPVEIHLTARTGTTGCISAAGTNGPRTQMRATPVSSCSATQLAEHRALFHRTPFTQHRCCRVAARKYAAPCAEPPPPEDDGDPIQRNLERILKSPGSGAAPSKQPPQLNPQPYQQCPPPPAPPPPQRRPPPERPLARPGTRYQQPQPMTMRVLPHEPVRPVGRPSEQDQWTMGYKKHTVQPVSCYRQPPHMPSPEPEVRWAGAKAVPQPNERQKRYWALSNEIMLLGRSMRFSDSDVSDGLMKWKLEEAPLKLEEISDKAQQLKQVAQEQLPQVPSPEPEVWWAGVKAVPQPNETQMRYWALSEEFLLLGRNLRFSGSKISEGLMKWNLEEALLKVKEVSDKAEQLKQDVQKRRNESS